MTESSGTVPEIKLVIFTVGEGRLKVYLPRGTLPSGKLRGEVSLDKLAKDIFRHTVDLPLTHSYFEQLYTFSTSGGIAIVYYILLPYHLTSRKKDDSWYNYQDLTGTLSDYSIISYARQRLRWKVEYTNVVYSLLPAKFTLTELQEVYEAILAKSLDKRNFRKKLLSLNILIPTGQKKRLGKARPAKMFSFRQRKLKFIEIL